MLDCPHLRVILRKSSSFIWSVVTADILQLRVVEMRRNKWFVLICWPKDWSASVINLGYLMNQYGCVTSNHIQYQYTSILQNDNIVFLHIVDLHYIRTSNSSRLSTIGYGNVLFLSTSLWVVLGSSLTTAWNNPCEILNSFCDFVDRFDRTQRLLKTVWLWCLRWLCH